MSALIDKCKPLETLSGIVKDIIPITINLLRLYGYAEDAISTTTKNVEKLYKYKNRCVFFTHHNRI